MGEENYWDDYYDRAAAANTVPHVPSQFGAFVASEFIGARPTIVELGCGNGRDSLFFARHGFRAIGVDASSSAIEMCNRQAPGNANFICSEIEDPKLLGNLRRLIGNDNVVVYARFFIHAIHEAAESVFFSIASELCQGDSAVAVEFRTNRDEALAKLTPAHYRRFIHPMDFLVRAQGNGFQASYFAEGFGYAKFRQDDAHVARFILRPAEGATPGTTAE